MLMRCADAIPSITPHSISDIEAKADPISSACLTYYEGTILSRLRSLQRV
jgi:hypothetical protein